MVGLMSTIFLTAAIIIFIYASTWFVVSVYKKRNDVADIAWGLGYVLLCVYLLFTQEVHLHAFIVYTLVSVWGLRLSLHIYKRNNNRPEDFRYKKWRDEWGSNFYIRSYLQVYLLQGFFLLVIISPVLFVASSAHYAISWISVLALAIWLFGFVYQSIADYQLSVFMANRKAGEIMQSGLWKYSRHPNYFGEIMMWWAVFFMILPLENSIYFIASPITITVLLVFVSGVPMLEKKYEGHTLYESYKKVTPALIPKFW
jgi:steroid 5-alpha reductase family enzyme